jgi:DNA-binding HxlR family transcriptional regulator
VTPTTDTDAATHIVGEADDAKPGIGSSTAPEQLPHVHTSVSVFGDSAGQAVPGAPMYSEFESEFCSIARTLALIGDRWTLLVLRDVANGVRRFDDLVSHLGVARNVLSRRLATLSGAGLGVRSAYRAEGARERHEYRLSKAGRELVPILLAIMMWGDRHLAEDEGLPVVARHADCGAQVRVLVTCEEGHELGDRPRLRLEVGPGSRRRGWRGNESTE